MNSRGQTPQVLPALFWTIEGHLPIPWSERRLEKGVERGREVEVEAAQGSDRSQGEYA
jgi:hypothetical protein